MADIEVPPNAETRLEQLKKRCQFLKSQYDFYKSFQPSNASTSTTEELSVTPAAARQREFSLLNDIDTLQNKLFELDSQKKRTELLIHRVIQQPIVQSIVFPQAGQELSPEDKVIREKISKRDALVSKLLGIHEQLKVIKQQSIDTDILIRKTKITNRVLFRRLKAVNHRLDDSYEYHAPEWVPMNQAKTSEVRRLEAELAEQLKYNQILRRVLQCLILGSEVNWAADPALCELFLSLEEPVDINSDLPPETSQ